MRDSVFERRLQTLIADHPREEELFALCDLYWEASRAQRDVLRERVRPTLSTWKQPERVNPASDPHDIPRLIIRIRRLLLWTAITGVSEDYRDTIMSVDSIVTCARPYDVDIRARLEEVAKVSPPDLASLLRGRMPRL